MAIFDCFLGSDFFINYFLFSTRVDEETVIGKEQLCTQSGYAVQGY